MYLNESDTRAKLIDPALYARGWTENPIRREGTTDVIEIIEAKPRKRARGRVDYLLRVAVNVESQPVGFIQAHATGNGGRARADISIYGQESNDTTWRLAKMNLAIRGIDGQIAHGDTFHNDRSARSCRPVKISCLQNDHGMV